MIPVKRTTKVEQTDDLSTLGNPWIAAPGSGWKLYIRRIIVNVIVSAAQSWTFRAATSNIEVAFLPLNAPAGDALILFGHAAPYALAENEGLEIIATAAGVEAMMSFDGFKIQV